MIRTPDDLARAGLIPDPAPLAAVAARYATAITPHLRALIQDADDPIGRQLIPHPGELATAPHEHADPVADEALSPVPGIVHRYPDRALLKPLLACPVYCRFCFRREQVGPGAGLLSPAALDAAIAWLAARPAIREVIVTGGDPLMLSPRRLGDIVGRLAALPHLEVLRLHTRMPVADPARITGALARACEASLPVWIVVHANHSREIEAPGVAAALTRLRREGGAQLLGQSVLLRGVNDSADALEALLRAMLRAGIKPYYLHQLDPAPGTARFHVPVEEGLALLRALRGRVSGLAWPTYVQDRPGGAGKVPLGPAWTAAGAGPAVVRPAPPGYTPAPRPHTTSLDGR